METTILIYIQEELLNNHRDIELSVAEDLLSSGLLDSMGIMRLMQFIEETYSLTIPPEDMTIENFNSVAVITNYLNTIKMA